MHDSNAAWAAVEGLLPIQEDFAAAGYTMAQVVGGITYEVLSPCSRNLNSPAAIPGRQLFTEYTSAVHLDPQVSAHADRADVCL
jgi:hypothetical protein